MYFQRQQLELASGIYNMPLPTVRGTAVEIFDELALLTLMAASWAAFNYLLLLAILTLIPAMFNLMYLMLRIWNHPYAQPNL